MWTHGQLQMLAWLSSCAWIGLVVGGLAGALTGVVLVASRACHVRQFFVTSACAIVSAAFLGIGVSLIAAALEVVFGKPDYKAGWDVPIWAMNAHIIAVAIAGAVGSCLIGRTVRATVRPRAVVTIVVVGGFFGALTHLLMGKVYVDFRSAGTIDHSAETGFFIGAAIMALWCFAIRRLHDSQQCDETIAANR